MNVQLGKMLLILGIILFIIGLLFLFSEKVGGFFGNLPGDVSYQGKNSSFYFPIATSIVLSIVLTIILNLFFWFFKK